MAERPTPIPPGPDQESVWRYPRPPKLERCDRHLKVIFDGETIAETDRGWRVLETSHPPNYYFPREDVQMACLQELEGQRSVCEWKGRAVYFDVVHGDQRAEQVAWSYPEPTDRFAELAGAVAFYAGRVDSCWVDGERVTPQPGGFYGGWITDDVVGPFKGVPGSRFW